MRLTPWTRFPEPLREFYQETDDGKLVLQVEGMVPKSKLDVFRYNNIKLVKERGKLVKALAENDPATAEATHVERGN